MVTLRPHQTYAIDDVDSKIGKFSQLGQMIRNILCVLPTGSGKSLTLAEYARRAYERREICVVFAHRDVLISQLSEALCKTGVPHSFICSDKARRDITNNNLQQFGDSYYDQSSTVIVSSTPTFAARLRDGKLNLDFLDSVRWWLQDEAHHTIDGNQWHKCLTSMLNATGIGFTATPIRGDRKGLGSHADGIFDDMSVTCNTYDLIKKGMLSPYKIYATSQVDIKGISRDKNGELNNKQLHMKTKEADITGDAVAQYKKHLDGQPVITFCINIEHAKEVAAEFNLAGVPSVAVSSKSSLAERQSALDGMKNGSVLNLVNVDLFGEGYDCPAIAGVIMLRRTTSYSLFKQQFGRMLRPSPGKLFGILLDHVGNTQYFMTLFGLHAPHEDPVWTLDRQDERKKRQDDDDDDDVTETIKCGECGAFGIVGTAETDNTVGLVFIYGVCPECGHVETEDEKVARVREIKVQAGELVELNNSEIDELINQREAMYKPVPEFAASLSNHFHAKYAAVNNHAVRQQALDVLRHWIQSWSEKHWKDTGKPTKLVQMDFETTFGINVLKAQTLTASAMNQLSVKIQQHYRR